MKWGVLLVTSGLMVSVCWADTIRIKGGGKFPGKIITQTEAEVVVQFEFGTMSFLPGEVEVLPEEEGTGGSGNASVPPQSAATPPPKAIDVPAPTEAAQDVTLPQALRSVAYLEAYQEDGTGASGSGVMINEHGVMLTNHHVIAGAVKIIVRLPADESKSRFKDPKTYDAVVMKSNPYYDLAIVDVHAQTPDYLRFASEETIRVGEPVRAIGNPQGLTISVSQGIVSAVRTNHDLGWECLPLPSESISDRECDEITWIQTDAAVNPGNSGGPLLNSKNDIVGINTSGFQPSGGSVGLNFALHVKHLRKFARGYLKPKDRRAE